MKKITLLYCLILILSIPTKFYASGVEIAGGAWYQKPSGDLSFDKSTKDDDFDLEDDLNYDDKWRPSVRLILDYNRDFFPNIYLMYTPMEWDEEGNKLKMNHFDFGLFYDLPFFKKATSDVLNFDLGLNFRLLDVKAEIVQKDTGIKESESYFLPLPMIQTGIQIEPFKYFALEFEGRGIGWSSNYYISLIGRLKVKPYRHFFFGGGYRYDNVDLDYQDLDIDTVFQGPFAEIGFEY